MLSKVLAGIMVVDGGIVEFGNERETRKAELVVVVRASRPLFKKPMMGALKARAKISGPKGSPGICNKPRNS